MRLPWPPQRRAARGRAERFDRLLAGSGMPDPSARPEDAELMALVGALRSTGAGVSGPAEPFRAALRHRLVAEVRPAPAAAPATARRRPARHRQFHLALGIVATVVLATAGTAVASTRALPGQSLYDMKRELEQVRLSLAWSDLGRGAGYLDLASTRLAEVTSLVTGAHSTDPRITGYVVAGLADQASSLRSGAALLEAVYRRDADPAALQALATSVADQRARLAAIMRLLPAPALAPARTLSDLLDALSLQSSTLLSACRSSCGVGQPAQPANASPAPTGTGGAVPVARPTTAGPGSATTSGGGISAASGTVGTTVGGLVPTSQPVTTAPAPSGLLGGLAGGLAGLPLPTTSSSPTPVLTTTTPTAGSTCLLGTICLP